jgi:hypothetical protein
MTALQGHWIIGVNSLRSQGWHHKKRNKKKHSWVLNTPIPVTAITFFYCDVEVRKHWSLVLPLYSWSRQAL